MAQLVEQRTRNAQVVRSNRTVGTRSLPRWWNRQTHHFERVAAARPCEFEARPGHHIGGAARRGCWQPRTRAGRPWEIIHTVSAKPHQADLKGILAYLPSSEVGVSRFESEGRHQIAKLTGIGIPGVLKIRCFPVRLRGFAPRTVAQSADARALKAMSPRGMPVRLRPVRPPAHSSDGYRAAAF